MHRTLLIALTLLALAAAGCGLGDAPTQTATTASEPTEPPQPADAEAAAPSPTTATDDLPADEDRPNIVTGDTAPLPVGTVPPAEPDAPVTQGPNLGRYLTDAVALLGRTDIHEAITTISPFPDDVPIPDGVLASLKVGYSNLRTVINDPSAANHLKTSTEITVDTRQSVEDLQSQFLHGLPAAGYEILTDGFEQSQLSDSSIDAYFQTAPVGQPRSTVTVRIDTANADYRSVNLLYEQTDETTEPGPIRQMAAGLPALPDATLGKLELSIFDSAVDDLQVVATISSYGPPSDPRAAADALYNALPSDNWLLPTDSMIETSDFTAGGREDLHFDIVYNGLDLPIEGIDSNGQIGVTSDPLSDQLTYRATVTQRAELPDAVSLYRLGQVI